MRFAHLADCHIGAWRVAALRELADEAFAQAISTCIEQHVDFVLIAGDLFHTALPGVEHVRHVVKHLTRLKQHRIPVYFIAGSHDFSPTGKTMLSVLEEAGLAKNVCVGEHTEQGFMLQPVQDEKTGVHITGILGKAGQLDSELYNNLRIQEVSGKKLFLFHTTLDELKPARMAHVTSASATSLLPQGFDYYAGGHVHIVGSTSLPGYAQIVYPGPLFPASFSELEELGTGGFYIVELNDGVKKTRIDLPVCTVRKIHISCDERTPQEVEDLIREQLTDLTGSIVLVRLTGMLSQGAAADIGFAPLFAYAQKQGAIACLRNTVGVRSPEFVEQEFTPQAAEKIEAEVIHLHVGQQPIGLSKEEEIALFTQLLNTLGQPQADGENKAAYELRVVDDAKNVLGR